MWNMFRISTFHKIVHCMPLIVLFVTHLLCLFCLKPHSISVSDNSHENINAACSAPYRTLLCLIYNTGLPFLFFHMYFQYSIGSSLMISSNIVPSNNICMSWSMYACKNVLRIYITTTYLPSFALLAHDIIIASSDTDFSVLVVYFLGPAICPSLDFNVSLLGNSNS